MRSRWIAALMLLVALCASSLASYHVRLWFKDEYTGAEGTGAIGVLSGDLISCNYSFHRDAGDTTSRWSILQMFMDLQPPGPNSILTNADANTWDDAIRAWYPFPPQYPTYLAWQPSDGPIHDNGVDPSDPQSALLTAKGVYALVGVSGTSPQSHDIDKLGFFTFHVGMAPLPGAELHWGREGYNTDNGITTRILDNKSQNVRITDNWLVVAPEPGTWAAVGIGLVGLLALRRRK